MHIDTITLTQFRCFTQKTISLGSSRVIIQGNNGSGKSSILEALHYLCYLRSFRTHLPRELVRFGHDHFFIKATGQYDMHSETIQVGFSNGQRRVRVNQKTVRSHKEILQRYRVVTITEDDLELVKQGPEHRRTFLDTVLLLQEPGYAQILKKYKTTLEQRNALLKSGVTSGELLQSWTEQLFVITRTIITQRTRLLEQISQRVSALLSDFFDNQLIMSLVYKARHNPEIHKNFCEFTAQAKGLYATEARFGRSCFGSHLDDVTIQLQNRVCRTYASRGQQKVAVLLLKVAAAQLLVPLGSPVLLLDDFVTDFDNQRLKQTYAALQTLKHSQFIFTTPMQNGPLHALLQAESPCQITL